MKFKCPSCGAPFDSLALDVDRVQCPNCARSFLPAPAPRPRRSRYHPDVEEAALDLLGRIRELVSGSADGIKQCALSHIQQEWLAPAGHQMTVKLGPCEVVTGECCSVCGKTFTGTGLALYLIDRWRATTTQIFLCDEHRLSAHLYAADIHLHKDNAVQRLGFA